MHAVLVHGGLVLAIDNCMEAGGGGGGGQESHTCHPNQFCICYASDVCVY